MHSNTIIDETLLSGHRLGDPLPKRVAVFRALELGDMLCAIPALRALRAALPQAHITLIGLPWAISLAQRFSHYIDDFIAFPGGGGLPERIAAAGEENAFAEATHDRFDLVLQLHGSGLHSNATVLKLGAPRNAGFFSPGEPCPDPQRFMPYPDDEPEIRRLLRLMTFMGVPTRGEDLEFPLSQDEREQAQQLVHLPSGGYVCIHAGARSAARRWSAQRFAVVGDVLGAHSWPVVLTGTEAEAGVTGAVRDAMRAPCVDLTGRTTLGQLAAVIETAQLVICNDTGVSHIAAALGVPSVVIFTGSDPRRWAPLDNERHRAVFYDVKCRPCDYRQCPIGHPCATGTTPHAVLENAFAILRRFRPQPHEFKSP